MLSDSKSFRTHLLTLAVFASSMVWSQSAPRQAAHSADVPAEQTYKNLRVLKGIPADQLIPTMQFISASLGVECGFCHVENHFDQDDKKPKQVARQMMEMMSAINRKNFDGHQVVTCNTCHRGMRSPAAIPAIPEGGPRIHLPGDEQQSASNLPNVDQVLAKYVQALGGASAVANLKSLSEKGTAEFAGRQIPVDISDESPNKRIFTIHMPGGDSVTAINGDSGWMAAPHRPVHEMSSGEVDVAKLDANLQLPLQLKQAFEELKAEPAEKLDDRDCYVLVGKVGGLPRARFYFDQQSGLLVRMMQYAQTALGLNPTRIDYSDYRPINGVQIPYRWSVARPAGQFTIQISDVTPNVQVDSWLFSRPTQ
jgi:photosynthetic reaction center cytochrome c subunit